MDKQAHYKFDFFRKTKELTLAQILLPAIVLTSFVGSGMLALTFMSPKQNVVTAQAAPSNMLSLTQMKEFVSDILHSDFSLSQKEEFKNLYEAKYKKEIVLDNKSIISGYMVNGNKNIYFSLEDKPRVTIKGLTQEQANNVAQIFYDNNYLFFSGKGINGTTEVDILLRGASKKSSEINLPVIEPEKNSIEYKLEEIKKKSAQLIKINKELEHKLAELEAINIKGK